ncbi:MAG: proton-conducting transporter membrane subunit [Hyphomicrobiaceae bacterium]
MFGLSLETQMLCAFGLPFVGAVAIMLCHRKPDLREAVTLTTAVVLALLVWGLLGPVSQGARPEARLIEILPGLALAFKVEPLGLLFALVASSLWIVNSVYSIGYMRAHEEPRQTTFYVCFAIAIGSAIGLAFSANLISLFLFYELLTLSTYPLVTHNADAKAIRGGRIYLIILVGTSMLLLLPAIVATSVLAGTTEFKAGGILPPDLDPMMIGILLGLFAFGIGKAALMPIHFWLPSAMVAPTPVSALLHAVAVVKAGVFTVLKVVVYVFGVEALSKSGANDWLIVASSASLVLASLVALTKDNLKARLAYSTVSQLAYVVLAASLATPAGIIAGSMQIAMHAVGKITLFFCAGAIYVATHKTEISELDGLGRAMPWTFTAFLVGSLSIIGLPPFGGMWTKWWLILGALDAHQVFVVWVLLLSSLLNVLYLLPIFIRAMFSPARKALSVGAAAAEHHEPEEGLERKYWLVVLPPCVTAFLCFVMFFLSGPIVDLIKPITIVTP